MSSTARRTALRRTLAGGAALALGAALLPAAPSLQAAAVERDITILEFSDYHGRITPDLTIPFAGRIEQLRQENGEDSTLLLSAGDNIGATLFESAVDDDDPTIDILNALDLSASAVGNHEFDQGFDDLTGDVIAGDEVGENPNGGRPAADWDYLGANVYEAGTEEPVLPEYGIYTVDGVDVGVIGAVTRETPTLVLPAGVEGLEFGDPVEAVNRVAEQLSDGDETNDEADVLVATYHEGFGVIGGGDAPELEDALGSDVFASIVNDTDDRVSAIINGHSHQAYDYDGPSDALEDGTRPIIQAGEYASAIGQITITVDETDGVIEPVAASAEIVDPIGVTDDDGDDDTSDEIEELTEELAADYQRIADIDTILNGNGEEDGALGFAAAQGEVVLGGTAGPITTAFSGGEYGEDGYTGGNRDDRSRESAMGNLVADALLTSLAPEDRGGAQISVVNPGGLRSEFDAGEITVAEANNVLPFLNNLNTITLTGEQFTTLLEQQWQSDENGNVPADDPFLQLGLSGNVSYTFDPEATQGEHINQVFVDGAPIDPDADYRIGTFSFLAQGGDNFRVFTEGTDLQDSGLVDREAWFAFLTTTSEASGWDLEAEEDEQEEGVGIPADYSKRSAVFTEDAPLEVTAGETLELTLSDLDQTSLAAPQVGDVGAVLLPEDGGLLADLLGGLRTADDDENLSATMAAVMEAMTEDDTQQSGEVETSAQAPDEGVLLAGTSEVVDGEATLQIEIPATVAGEPLDGTNQLFLVTDTLSLIGVTVEIEAAEVDDEPSPEPEPTPTPEPTEEPSAEPTPTPAPVVPGPGTGPDDLADTGSSTATTAALALGALLLLAGGATLVAARRRSSRS